MVEINVTITRRFRFRMWLTKVLLMLAAMAIGAEGHIEISLTGIDMGLKDSTPNLLSNTEPLEPSPFEPNEEN